MRVRFWLVVLGGIASGIAPGRATCPAHATGGGSGDAPARYAPPLVSNGSLSLQVDYRGEQAQRPHCRMTPCIHWAGRRYGPPHDALIPFGHFDSAVAVDGKDIGAPSAWVQTLDTTSATVVCRNEFAAGVSVETLVFVPLDRDMVVVRRRFAAQGGCPRKLRHTFRYQFTAEGAENRAPRRVTSDVMWNGTARCAEFHFRADAHRPCEGVVAVFSDRHAVPAIDRQRVSLVTEIDVGDGLPAEQTFFLAFAASLDGDDWAARVRGLLECARRAGCDGLLTAHRDAWNRYWERSYVRVPDQGIERAYRTAQYHLRVNATKWSFPVGLFNTHWAGRFFAWDEAFCHLALASSNRPEIARRMPEFRFAGLQKALYRAGHGNRPGRYGARYPWETLEDGSEGATSGYWMDHVFHMANIAMASWFQFLYTDDAGYLKNTGYPVIRECARFFRAHMVYEEQGGDLYIGKCTDLERLGPARQRAFLTTCGAIHTLESAAAAAARCGADPEEAAQWRCTAARLRVSLPHREGRYIPYPDCTVDSIATLAGLFPYPIFDETEERQRKAVYHFIENARAAGNMYPVGDAVCAWYAGQIASALARLGDKIEPARLLSEAAGGAGCFGELFEINEPKVSMRPWFATASGTFVYAINQMLVQSRGDEIRIAAGIPEAWRDYAFKLACHGGLVAEAAVKDARIVALTLTPAADGVECRRTLVLPERLADRSAFVGPGVLDVGTRDGHRRVAVRIAGKTQIVRGAGR